MSILSILLPSGFSPVKLSCNFSLPLLTCHIRGPLVDFLPLHPGLYLAHITSLGLHSTSIINTLQLLLKQIQSLFPEPIAQVTSRMDICNRITVGSPKALLHTLA